MSPEEPHDLHGEALTADELDQFLLSHGVGVLSLADGNDAYGIPMSYGYDADQRRLFFAFLRTGAESRKERLAEATGNASFLVYAVESEHEWTSVVLDGALRTVDEDEWDDFRSALEANAWHPSLFSASEPDRGIGGWEFVVEEASGRTSP